MSKATEWKGPMECKTCGRRFLYHDQAMEVVRWEAHNPGPKLSADAPCTGALTPYDRRALDPAIVELINDVAKEYERDKKRPHYRRMIDDSWRDGALDVIKRLRESLQERYPEGA